MARAMMRRMLTSNPISLTDSRTYQGVMMDTECGYDQLLSLVMTRRSVRHFRPDLIPDGYIERMIEIARWAPSGFHSQPWEFVVI
jgi:hypothetical protein